MWMEKNRTYIDEKGRGIGKDIVCFILVEKNDNARK